MPLTPEEKSELDRILQDNWYKNKHADISDVILLVHFIEEWADKCTDHYDEDPPESTIPSECAADWTCEECAHEEECNKETYGYDNDDCNKFCNDMEEAGLEIEHYHGRFSWEGPAVRVDDIQTVLSNTKVPCQWDNMGLGFIVYPKSKGKKIGD